jgi:hypothetical protein
MLPEDEEGLNEYGTGACEALMGNQAIEDDNKAVPRHSRRENCAMATAKRLMVCTTSLTGSLPT